MYNLVRRIGLVLVLAMAGKGLADVAANFDIVCRMNVGYGPRPAKCHILERTCVGNGGEGVGRLRYCSQDVHGVRSQASKVPYP
jgi:hypothetical protein